MQIACQYITTPLLFHLPADSPIAANERVKFDVRYIVVVRRWRPLDARVYKRFWLRFATKCARFRCMRRSCRQNARVARRLLRRRPAQHHGAPI